MRLPGVNAGPVGPDALQLIPIQPDGQLPPIYIVHGSDRTGPDFAPMAEILGPDQPVLGLCLDPQADPPPGQVPKIARRCLDPVIRHQPQGPLSLIALPAGHDVVLEMARQLLASGREVLVLMMLADAGPASRPEPSITARIEARLKRLVHPATSSRHQAPDLAPYPGRLTVLQATGPTPVTRIDPRQVRDWQSLAGGGLDLVRIPGDTLTMLAPPHLARLAAEVKTAILRSSRNPRP